jgi:hypothetical protein
VRVAAGDDERAHPLGMARGERDRGARAPGDPEQLELREPQRVRDRLDRLDLGLECRLVIAAIRESGAGPVVADDRAVAGEPLDERAELGEAPLELEVADPECRQQQRRAGADGRIGDPAIAGVAEADLLHAVQPK